MAAPLLLSHGVKLGDVRTAIETLLADSTEVERAPPAEIATRAAHQIDQIEASIDALAVLSAGSSEARAIRKSFRTRLKDLKRLFRS